MSGTAMAPVMQDGIYGTVPRMVSLFTAIALAGLVLTYPRALGEAGHGLSMLTMFGICVGFVHGVGYVPEHKTLRALFGPWTAWPLMALGAWLMLG